MTVSVRLFAILRERAGSDRVELELPDGATVADALAALARMPALSEVLARLPVQLAVNRDYASRGDAARRRRRARADPAAERRLAVRASP